jgi:hypothetical protein
VSTVLQKRNYNFFNVMDIISEARLMGEEEGYLLASDGSIHFIEVLWEESDGYDLTVNDINFGDFQNMGKVYEKIKQCCA